MSTINAQISNNRKGRVFTLGKAPVKGVFIKLEKDLIVYKKVVIQLKKETKGIATLVIPAGTVIYKANGVDREDKNKCRAEQAIVLKVQDLNGKEVKVGWSTHEFYPGHNKTSKPGQEFERLGDWGSYRFVYRPLTKVFPLEAYSFDDEACKSGIHFFMTADQAISY